MSTPGGIEDPPGAAEEGSEGAGGAVRQALEELESWLLSAEALGLPEHVVEAALAKRGREVYRLMRQRHWAEQGPGEVGAELLVREGEGKVQAYRARRVDSRKLVSIFGEVRVQRRAYVAPGRKAVPPLDARLQLPQRSFSYAVQRRVVEEAVRGPFDEVIESLERQTGKVLSKRSVEQITVDAAQDFEAFDARRAAPAAEGTGPILVGAID